MILDELLMLSKAQAVIKTETSEDIIDLQVNRDIGEGKEVYFIFSVNETFAGLTDLDISVVTAEDETLITKPIELGSRTGIKPASLKAGKSFFIRVNPLIGELGKRYIGVKYTVTGTGTTGKVSCNVSLNIQDGMKHYPTNLEF